MRVKHGTQIRFVLRAGAKVLKDTTMDVTLLGAHLTVCGFMYNGLTMSGGVSWTHPADGKPIDRPTYTVTLVDPTDELTGDQLCDCADCVPTTAGRR